MIELSDGIYATAQGAMTRFQNVCFEWPRPAFFFGREIGLDDRRHSPPDETSLRTKAFYRVIRMSILIEKGVALIVIAFVAPAADIKSL